MFCSFFYEKGSDIWCYDVIRPKLTVMDRNEGMHILGFNGKCAAVHIFTVDRNKYDPNTCWSISANR